jgi:hypothetical protein
VEEDGRMKKEQKRCGDNPKKGREKRLRMENEAREEGEDRTSNR